MFEDGAIGGVRTGQRRGVRKDGAPSRLGLPNLGDDQRLAGGQGLLGDAAEFRRRFDVLEQQQEDVGLAFVEHEVDEIRGFEKGLVAGGDDVAEGEIAPAGAVEKGKTQTAALRDHRDLAAERMLRQKRARACIHRRAEGWAEAGGDVGKALGVGSSDGHVVTRRGGAQRRLHALAGLARFLGEART